MKKFLFLALICLFTFNVFSQSDQNQLNSEVGVEEIFLAKDDGNGKAGKPTEDFLTTDVPIYCIVQLDSMDAATVKMNLVAVNVVGVKPETRVFTVSYKTNGNQSRVNFTGSPEGNWVEGNYRFDIFINDKPAGKKNFAIKNSTAKASVRPAPPTAKPARKTKSGARFRRQ